MKEYYKKRVKVDFAPGVHLDSSEEEFDWGEPESPGTKKKKAKKAEIREKKAQSPKKDWNLYVNKDNTDKKYIKMSDRGVVKPLHLRSKSTARPPVHNLDSTVKSKRRYDGDVQQSLTSEALVKLPSIDHSKVDQLWEMFNDGQLETK